MHAVIYNLFNYKTLYEDIINNLVEELSKKSTHFVYIVWSYDSTENLGKILKHAENLFENERIFISICQNLSFAQSRNFGLFNIKNSIVPYKYLTFFEDDHFYYSNGLEQLEAAIDKYWGKTVIGDLKVGTFTYCMEHKRTDLVELEENIFIPKIESNQKLGSINSCMRSGPIQHFLIHTGGYELDEYPISFYQTNAQNIKNYNKGFTTMFLSIDKQSSHDLADVPENSLGLKKVNDRFNPEFAKSHHDLLSQANLQNPNSDISLKKIIRFILNKLFRNQ